MLTLLYNCRIANKEKDSLKQEIVPLSKFWEKAIPHQDIPEGLTSLSAEYCGTCHQDIYNEWKQSIHALAFQDLQFQAEWEKDKIYACLNCHTPLQNQQKYLVSGLINGDHKTPVKTINPHFDEKLQQEGITCASCHVREGVIMGTMETQESPHKTENNPEFLSEKLCISCHNVVDELNPVLVCTFETGDEWRNNRFIEAGKNCISCHMPEIKRPIAAGMAKRRSHVHSFPGSGIPKFFDKKAPALDGLQIMEDSIRRRYAAGDNFMYFLTVKNSFAGHKVPTGDPERFILINFKIMDRYGNIQKEHQYRVGEEWQWFPEAKKLADNNFKPNEVRTFDFEYEFQNKGEYTLVVEITKHRMTEENARYHGILGEYPLLIKIFSKKYTIKVY